MLASLCVTALSAHATGRLPCRDKQTGKSRGFAFLAYADQRSTDLAVDNLNGYSIDGRIIGVDHVKDYKRLKDNPDYVDPKDQQVQLLK